MVNSFRLEIGCSGHRTVVIEPWEDTAIFSEFVLESGGPPTIRRNGKLVEIICANGTATYQLLPQHENDIDAGVHRARLIEGVWSPAGN